MLTSADIQSVRRRYLDEKALYRVLAQSVHGLLIGVLDAEAIKHMVTYRVKGEDSLERKLSSDENRRQYAIEDFEDGLSPPLKNRS